MMDRIDIQLITKSIDPKKLVERRPAESTAQIASRVLQCREIQKERFAGMGIFCNAGMDNKLIEKHCHLDSRSRKLLEKLIEKLGLSARACSRIIKIARTIADMEKAENIAPEHLAEAAGYRILDRNSQEW
jgi:magnesium chelatase family protein